MPNRYFPQRYGRPREDVVPLSVAERIAAERDALAGQVDQARRQLATLRRTLEAREEERRHLLQAGRALQTEVQALRSSGAAARAIPQASGEVERLHRQVRELQRELDTTRRARDLAVEERSSATDDCAAARAERDAAQAALQHAEARIGELEGTHPDQARLQRLAADLANVRRRRDEEIAAGVRKERVRLMKRFGDLRDSLDRAVRASSDTTSPWYHGMVGILQQVDAILRAESVELVGTPGDRFDPRLHEAVGVDHDADRDSNVVLRVERPGLRLDDGTLVRPAQVITSG